MKGGKTLSDQSPILSPSDVCTLLKIKLSTLRKYAIILKEVGYHFDENDRGQRAYYEKDVIAIKKFIEIKSANDMTLEQSANALMTWLGQSDMSVRVTGNNKEIDHDVLDSLIKKIDELTIRSEKQENFNMELLKILDRQQTFIEQNSKERDILLVGSMRQMLEERQLQIAATKEEEKKNFWQRLSGLFGK